MIYARTTVSIPTGIRISAPFGGAVKIPDPEMDESGGQRYALVKLQTAILSQDGDKVEVQLQIEVPDIELVYHDGAMGHEAGVIARFKS